MGGKKKENVKVRTVIISAAIIALVFILAVGAMIYVFGARDSFSGAVAKVIPYPAAVVDGSIFVGIKDLNANLASVKRFYESQDFSQIGFRVDFATEDGKKRLKVKERKTLNKLIENRIIEKLASQRGVEVTSEMAMQNVSMEMSRYGNEEYVKKNLLNLYGWSIDDFVEKLVKPDLYRSELEKKVRETDIEYAAAKEKIGKAQDELKGKKDFSAVAAKYSEAESAKNGGDLGWFTADQMIPEIAISLFPMKKGDVSDVIQSPLGFHIVQIEDRKTEDGIDKIKVRQILVRTRTFADWLTGQEKNMSIRIPLKDYYWDKERSKVEFTDAGMRDFEDNLDKNSAGDISVLF
jgi:flagellar basal body-associated protein FliL